MALTKPYFNTIPAFNATSSNTITMSVLGGQAITTYGYIIYNQATSAQVTSGTINVSTDISSEDIRNFNITIAANTLSNNTSYYIIGYTQSASISSPYSTPEYFTCYANPTFTGSITNASNNIISNSYANLLLSFTPATNSTTLFNHATITAYGINRTTGAQEQLYSNNEVYDLTSAITIPGLSPTCTDSSGTDDPNSLYSSYSIYCSGYTTDLMPISFSLTSLKCYYAQSSNSLALTAKNIPSEGRVLITCEISNVLLAGDVSSVEILRQESGSTEWNTLQTIQKNVLAGFSLYDPFCKNQTVYTYKVIPYDSNGNAGTEYTTTVLSCFDNAFICDQNTYYNITAELSLGAMAYNQVNTSQTPYGSQFPFVGYNAKTKFRSGTISCQLIANNDRWFNGIDRMAQVKLNDEFNDWLTNRRVKVFKDYNGNLFILATTGAISNSFYKVLGNGLASTSFSFQEVGLFTDDYLANLDIYNNFLSVVNSFTFTNAWETKTWTGLASFPRLFIWNLGNKVYYSISSSQYQLNSDETGWISKTWTGLTSFSGLGIWEANGICYYSNDTSHYVLDTDTDTWSVKEWSGVESLTQSQGDKIWNDGDSYYYSYGSSQYSIDFETSTWTPVSDWTGVTNFSADYIWKIGDKVYYSSGTSQYELQSRTHTWVSKTWTGLTNFVGWNVWNIGGKYYYSEESSGSTPAKLYVLDIETSTWSQTSWTGLTDFDGQYIWKSNLNIYYSNGNSQYKLTKTTN